MDLEELKVMCASHERQLQTIAESMKVQGDLLRAQVEFFDKVGKQKRFSAEDIGSLCAVEAQH